MNYEEFKDKLLQDLKERGVKAEFIEISGEERLTLGEGKIRPNVNFKKLYEDSKFNPYYDIIEACIEIEKRERPDINVEEICEFEKTQKRLFPVLTSKANLKTNAPYVRWNDLYIQYRMLYPEKQYSALVSNQMMEVWGVDVNEIHEAAIKYGPVNEPYRLPKAIDLIVEHMVEEGCPEEVARRLVEDDMDMKVFILTNKDKNYGTSVVLYPNVLEEIGKEIGEDFYLIPSSRNEWFIYVHDVDIDDVNNIIKRTNNETLKPEEVLSDHVYKYLIKSKEIVCL